MALYLDFPRFSPEWISDEGIANVVNHAWKDHPPMFEVDCDGENNTREACARDYSDGTPLYPDEE